MEASKGHIAVKVKSEPDDEGSESGYDIDPSSAMMIKLEVLDEEEEAEAEEKEKEKLTCQKCQISYENKFSYRNHVSVCDRNSFNRPMSKEELANSDKIRAEIRESVKLLERSCFSEFEERCPAAEPPGAEAAFSCSVCSVQFSTVRQQARHVYAHTFVKKEAEEFCHICADCGVDFPNLIQAQMHLKAKRCENFPKLVYRCEVCGIFFTRKDNLREHLRDDHVFMIKSGAKKRKKSYYACKACDKIFGGASLRAIHYRSHNNKRLTAASKSATNQFACNSCKRTFSCSQSLRKHSIRHTEDKVGKCYKCSKCGNAFPNKCSAQAHERWHGTDASQIALVKETNCNNGNSAGDKGDFSFNDNNPILKTYTRKKRSVKSEITIKQEPMA